MKVLILAGGFAKRLWPLTLDKSKALLPLAGKQVLSHILDKLPVEAEVVVSTNNAFESEFHAWRAQHLDRKIEIFVEPAKVEGEKRGALAAVAQAINHFGQQHNWLVIGGDNFFTFSLEQFLSADLDQPKLVVYDVGDRELAKRLGVVDMAGNKVTRFLEKPEQPPTTLIATGCFYFPQAILSHVLAAATQTPDQLGAVFIYLLAQGVEVRGYRLPGYWNDIGTFDAYLHAHRHAGADLAIPLTLQEQHLKNVFVGTNHIDPTCRVLNSRITNSIVLPGAVIENCTLEGCIVNQDVVVYDQIRHHEIIHSEPLS